MGKRVSRSQAHHPVVTPTLAHPVKLSTPFSMPINGPTHAHCQGWGTDKSQGPGSPRPAGVQTVYRLFRQLMLTTASDSSPSWHYTD